MGQIRIDCNIHPGRLHRSNLGRRCLHTQYSVVPVLISVGSGDIFVKPRCQYKGGKSTKKRCESYEIVRDIGQLYVVMRVVPRATARIAPSPSVTPDSRLHSSLLLFSSSDLPTDVLPVAMSLKRPRDCESDFAVLAQSHKVCF